MSTKIGDYTGYSDSGLTDAIENALQKAVEQHSHFEIIETRGIHAGEDKRHYQVTLSLFSD
ncbi:TPA: dodecin domain-containing protein [Legionella feeleii]|uniref:Dodecin domain-containing protein n=1 Tax=Legionella feeleii TaxID=453 RepID=A0A0W0U942_9GAMM|nr:dodecin domain-containing protein [Legionella feeleii]KTD04151.1 hypothetical protein Lfee_0239 [Legionella feeleii]SPX60737.1 Uncharacterised protein [Legionella feeleii]STX39712.1 Uncharacterised protein [Legionella feeleii]